jgi:hypothetical protein
MSPPWTGGGDSSLLPGGYEGDRDDLTPHGWSFGKRLRATAIIASIGWIVGFVLSVDSFVLPLAEQEFRVSEFVEPLALFLRFMVIGFANIASTKLVRNGRERLAPAFLVLLFIF